MEEGASNVHPSENAEAYGDQEGENVAGDNIRNERRKLTSELFRSQCFIEIPKVSIIFDAKNGEDPWISIERQIENWST